MTDSTIRVLKALRHGGHVIEDTVEGARDLARQQEGIVTSEDELGQPTVEGIKTTRFDYLFAQLVGQPSAHLPADDTAKVVVALKALGAKMIEQDPRSESGDSTIPAIYTYLGQFIDHDLTANTDRDTKELSDLGAPNLHPMPPEFIKTHLENLRQPALNLDSVYGDGPALGGKVDADKLYDGIKLRLGSITLLPPGAGELIPPVDDMERDLPRVTKDEVTKDLKERAARIGDARNDENLIVAQLHVAFLRFHNETVDWIKKRYPYLDDAGVFARAKQLVQFHYQWLVVHDFLRTITSAGVTEQVLFGGPKFFGARDGQTYMPLEFSVAAFRFGHSMVRGGYDYNRNFGTAVADPPPASHAGFASLGDLFEFTGTGGLRGLPTLPSNWPIEWDRFVDKGSASPGRFTRKIDTVITPPLDAMPNQGNDAKTPDLKALLKQLAQRNLLRGYVLNIPTGQAVAQAMGVQALTPAELQQGNGAELNSALASGGFIDRTPLWYYVLKEAEVRGNGNSLGPVGSRIVAETIIGQIRLDAESYLNHLGGWSPAAGVSLPNGDLIVTFADFLRFAKVL